MYFDPNEDNPGPGAYKANYKHVSTLRGVPEYTIGTHITDHPFVTPGVGTYNIGRDGNANPKYTMAQHLKPIVYTDVPGPGAYHTDQALKHTHVRMPHHSIATLLQEHPFLTPGVGTYHIGRDGNTAPKYTIAKRFVEKPSSTPGPGHYSPDQPGSAPAYSIGLHIQDHPFPTPGVGTYNIGTDGNTAPAFTMGVRFVRLRDKLKDKRYHAAVKERPTHRSAGNSPARSRAASRLKGAQPWKQPASPPLMMAGPAMKQNLNWARPSTWDITAPLVMNPRPRPMTSSENILRRIHFKIGPTQNVQYNEYIREMYRYMGNKGVRYGQVAKWGTSKSFIKATSRNKSFIKATSRNKSFIGRGEL